MDITKGVPFTNNNVTRWRPWHTSMERVEEILKVGYARTKANKPPPVPDGYKKCGNKQCGRILPATLEHFKKTYARNGRGNPLSYRCRDCLNRADRTKRAKKKARR